MFYLRIDKEQKPHFIYQQIYRGIKESILEGRLKPDEKLPSKRELATQIKVSINSVVNAYEQLLAEGYIYTTERRGYYVENIAHFIQAEAPKSSILPEDLKENSFDKVGWLSLSHMSSGLSLFPFKEWLKCQQKAIIIHKDELSEFPHPQGPYLVRTAICRLIALTRGVRCEPEQIVIGSGTLSLIRQLMAIQKKSYVMAVENPGYSRMYRLLNTMEFAVQPVDLDDKGIMIEGIENSNANFAFVTPSHQFPTGKIMPISRRIELLNWSSLRDERYIVEDDYDSEFKYETDNIPSLQSLDRNQRVIYIGTFSKTMLPGLRISYMVLPPAMLREYRRHYQDLIPSTNTLNLYTLNYFIDSGEYNKHVKRMNHLYEMKRKLLISSLRERFKTEIQIEDVPAGLHIFIFIKTKRGYDEIEERAKLEKLELYTLKRFILKNQPSQSGVGLVLGFANIDEDKIEEAINRLYRVLY